MKDYDPYIYVADIQMKQKIANSPFYDRLHHPDRPVIVFDGAMGSNLQLQNLTAADFGGEKYEGCNEYLVHTKPGSVATVHCAFSFIDFIGILGIQLNL
jgi:hypothetical protein